MSLTCAVYIPPRVFSLLGSLICNCEAICGGKEAGCDGCWHSWGNLSWFFHRLGLVLPARAFTHAPERIRAQASPFPEVVGRIAVRESGCSLRGALNFAFCLSRFVNCCFVCSLGQRRPGQPSACYTISSSPHVKVRLKTNSQKAK